MNEVKGVNEHKTDNIQSKAFANKHGYIRKFSSAYMEYSGDRFDISAQPVRKYCDNDYTAAMRCMQKLFML